MKIILTVITLFLISSCNNRLTENEISLFKEDKILTFDSDDFISSDDTTLHKILRPKLSEDSIFSKNGKYWEGMTFVLNPLAKIIANQHTYLFILKDVQMIDGELQELYVLQLSKNGKILLCKKITEREITANCDKKFTLSIQNFDGEIMETETCDFPDTSVLYSRKIKLAFDKEAFVLN